MVKRRRIDIDLESERFRIHSLKVADATPRWGEWLNDPHAAMMLNTMPRQLLPAELQAYIRSFDQISRLLLGIFLKASGQLIGFGTADIIEGGRKVVPTVLIGEPDFRNFGVITELRDVVARHFFEVLGFEAAVASVLSHNTIVVRLLEARGWEQKRRLAKHKKSASGPGYQDVLIYELSRESWRRYARSAGLIS